MSKQVCDISATAGMSRGQSNEHLRNYKVIDPDAKKYGYYDPTRMHLNFEVTKGGVISPVNKEYSLAKRFEDNLKERGIEKPKPYKMKDGTEKERRCLANIILGGSRDRMLELAFGSQKVDLAKGADNRHITRKEDIEKWAIDQYRLMAKIYGEENIVSFVVHLDEKNPHVHCSIVPVVDGKISYNKVFGETKDKAREKFKSLHDSIAKVNEKWGLKRGENINLTGAKHRTTEEYLQWLREECNKMEQDYGNAKDRVSGMKDSLKLLENEIRKQEIKAKGLTTMIRNLEQKQVDLEAEVLSSDMVLQQNEQAKKNLDILIQSNQELLGKRRKELDDTKELLELLKKQHAEKLQEVKETNEKLAVLQKEMKELNNDKIGRLETELFSDVGEFLLHHLQHGFFKDMQGLRKELSLESRKQFDSIFERAYIPEFSEHGDDIIKTAAALFLGREGQAIEIASSAGGGGGPEGGWRGKKDDEDEYEFRRRCFATACYMIRHPTQRKLKR